MIEANNREIENLSGEEFARRGNDIFEERIRPEIDDLESDARKFVAIDIETGDYEVSESEIRSMEATHRLLERKPEARGRIFLRRVGSESAHRMGAHFRPPEKNIP